MYSLNPPLQLAYSSPHCNFMESWMDMQVDIDQHPRRHLPLSPGRVKHATGPESNWKLEMQRPDGPDTCFAECGLIKVRR